MPVLVTGATGLVGNNLVRQLLAMGRAVRVLARPHSDPRPLQGLDVEVVAGDLRDERVVQTACRDVSAVIHAAALLHIGRRYEALQTEINVQGTRHVARAARLAQARFFNISTINALGASLDGRPFTEDSLTRSNVACGYVRSKQEAERIVHEEFARGLDAVSFFPGTLFGPWDWKPSTGRMIVEVVRRQPLMAPRGGVSVADVSDVASVIVRALEVAPSGRRYILGGNNLTYFDLWTNIAKLAGTRPPLASMGPIISRVVGLFGDFRTWVRGQEDDLNSRALAMSRLFHYGDSSLAKSELSYEIRPLDEILRRAYFWLVEHHYV